MKLVKGLLILALALSLTALTACGPRDNRVSSSIPAVSVPAASVPPVVSTPPAVSPEPDYGSLPDFRDESGLEDFESGEGFNDREDDLVTDDDVSREDLLADESVAAAMSTDFSQIGALSADLVEWGSGGPTDDSGRPNGCTFYQQKYADYDAYFILPESQKVYLTFDEGYENGFTADILDTLKEKNVKAVFFITYHFAKSQPDLVRRMIDEGHTLGNHSTAHKPYPSLPLAEAAKDLYQVHEFVKDNFGYEMTLFRFPEGKFSEQTLALVKSFGYKSLFWSFAYKDYDVNNQPLTVEALDKITSKAHPGALYLLHAVSRTNAEVLADTIDILRNNGFTVSAWDVF